MLFYFFQKENSSGNMTTFESYAVAFLLFLMLDNVVIAEDGSIIALCCDT